MEIKFNNQFFNNSEKNVLILGGNGGIGGCTSNFNGYSGSYGLGGNGNDQDFV